MPGREGKGGSSDCSGRKKGEGLIRRLDLHPQRPIRQLWLTLTEKEYLDLLML